MQHALPSSLRDTLPLDAHFWRCCSGIPPFSWADSLVLGAKVSAELGFAAAKKKRLGPGADIDTISAAFGADFPVNLGRIDASEPDPAGRFPDPHTASPQEVQVSCHTAET